MVMTSSPDRDPNHYYNQMDWSLPQGQYMYNYKIASISVNSILHNPATRQRNLPKEDWICCPNIQIINAIIKHLYTVIIFNVVGQAVFLFERKLSSKWQNENT